MNTAAINLNSEQKVSNVTAEQFHKVVGSSYDYGILVKDRDGSWSVWAVFIGHLGSDLVKPVWGLVGRVDSEVSSRHFYSDPTRRVSGIVVYLKMMHDTRTSVLLRGVLTQEVLARICPDAAV